LARLLTLARHHPGWTSFLFLALVIVPFILFEARNAPMEPAQRLWLALAGLGTAGFCGWVISLAVTITPSR